MPRGRRREHVLTASSRPHHSKRGRIMRRQRPPLRAHLDASVNRPLHVVHSTQDRLDRPVGAVCELHRSVNRPMPSSPREVTKRLAALPSFAGRQCPNSKVPVPAHSDVAGERHSRCQCRGRARRSRRSWSGRATWKQSGKALRPSYATQYKSSVPYSALIEPVFRAYDDGMTTIPLTEAKAKLNELVDEALSTHERVTITRRGKPAVVLISVEDLKSMEETLHWQSQPGVREDLQASRAEAEAGQLMDEASVRRRYGVGTAR